MTLGKRATSIIGVLLLAFTISGCGSQQVQPSDAERDPWESYNRKIHSFNTTLDRYVMKPVARGYDAVMPDAPQRGVRNFLTLLLPFFQVKPSMKFQRLLEETGLSVK